MVLFKKNKFFYVSVCIRLRVQFLKKFSKKLFTFHYAVSSFPLLNLFLRVLYVSKKYKYTTSRQSTVTLFVKEIEDGHHIHEYLHIQI